MGCIRRPALHGVVTIALVACVALAAAQNGHRGLGDHATVAILETILDLWPASRLGVADLAGERFVDHGEVACSSFIRTVGRPSTCPPRTPQPVGRRPQTGRSPAA